VRDALACRLAASCVELVADRFEPPSTHSCAIPAPIAPRPTTPTRRSSRVIPWSMSRPSPYTQSHVADAPAGWS
jgi:hypothetical protein